MKNKFIKLSTSAYGLWGFYNGFNGTSNLFPASNSYYFTDKCLLGLISGSMYVAFAPISLFYDIRKLEDIIRKE